MNACYFKVDSSNWEKKKDHKGEYKISPCGKIVEKLPEGRQFFSLEAALREAATAGKRILSTEEYKTFLENWNWKDKSVGYYLTWGGFGCHFTAEPMYGEKECDFWSVEGKVVQIMKRERDCFRKGSGFETKFKSFEPWKSFLNESFFQVAVWQGG